PFFFFSSRRRHTRFSRDWSSDVCSSDLITTIGNRLILPVWIRVSVSKNSSSVPKPPGRTIKAKEYLRSNSLRTKKYSIVTNRSRSEERRVGKECRSRWSTTHSRKKQAQS